MIVNSVAILQVFSCYLNAETHVMAHKTSINIILTVGTIAALIYGAIVGREYLSQGPATVDAPPLAELKFVSELDPQYEIFNKEDCQLDGVDEWTANAIKIRYQGRVYQFRPYFVETPKPELLDSTQDILRIQAEYFGDPPLSKLMEQGEAANQFLREILTERPFRIITRFEPERGTKSLYAFIQVDIEENTKEGVRNIRKYLSAILVREGLASITAKSSHTPFGQNALDFRGHLVSEREKAINDRSGIWAYSRLAQKLDELRQEPDSKSLEIVEDNEEELTTPE